MNIFDPPEGAVRPKDPGRGFLSIRIVGLKKTIHEKGLE